MSPVDDRRPPMARDLERVTESGVPPGEEIVRFRSVRTIKSGRRMIPAAMRISERRIFTNVWVAAPGWRRLFMSKDVMA
jgi:hypothetical protein